MASTNDSTKVVGLVLHKTIDSLVKSDEIHTEPATRLSIQVEVSRIAEIINLHTNWFKIKNFQVSQHFLIVGVRDTERV